MRMRCQCCADIRREDGYVPAVSLISFDDDNRWQPMCESCCASMHEINDEELGVAKEKEIPVDFEDDIPPAGTPCSTCHDCGHFCPAKRWAKGTDVALCLPCSEERDCDTFATIRLGENSHDILIEHALPDIGRVVPRSEWKDADMTIADKPVAIADVPFGFRNEVRQEQKKAVQNVVTKAIEQKRIPEPEEVLMAADNATVEIMAPQKEAVNARDMVFSLNDILKGVVAGTVKADAANAACQIVNTMLKCVETDWRMNQGRK